jgi:hypothetical protein
MDSPEAIWVHFLGQPKKYNLPFFSFGNICKRLSWVLDNCLQVSTNIWFGYIRKMTTFAGFSTCYLFYG